MQNKQRGYKVHIGTVICYALWLCLLLLGYLFFHGYIIWLSLLLFLLFPVCSMIGASKMRTRITVRSECVEPIVYRGQKGNVWIYIDNTCPWVSLHSCIHCLVGNKMYHDRDGLRLEMPIRAKGTEKMLLPLVSDYSGTLQLQLQELEYQDLFGFVSFRIALEGTEEISVLPNSLKTEKEQKQVSQTGMQELEEATVKGMDQGEVTDMREYRPGDRMRDIHWKLSAKKRQWMVKERSGTAQMQLVVVMDLSQNHHQMEENLQKLYHVLEEFLQNWTPVCVLWWEEEQTMVAEHLFADSSMLSVDFAEMLLHMKQTRNVNIQEKIQRFKPTYREYLELKDL